MAKGAVVKATRLTEKFGAEEYLSQHDKVVPLFALPPDGTIAVSTLDTPLQLRVGSTVVSLVSPMRRRSTDPPAVEPAASD